MHTSWKICCNFKFADASATQPHVHVLFTVYVAIIETKRGVCGDPGFPVILMNWMNVLQ